MSHSAVFEQHINELAGESAQLSGLVYDFAEALAGVPQLVGIFGLDR
jgi:hypothetical protein